MLFYQFSEEELNRTLSGMYAENPYTDKELAECFISGWDDESCKMLTWINGWIYDITAPELCDKEDLKTFDFLHWPGIIQWWEPLPYGSGDSEDVAGIGVARFWWDSVEVESLWMQEGWSTAPKDLDDLGGRLCTLMDLPAYLWPAHVKQKQFDLDWRDKTASIEERMSYYGLPGFEKEVDSRKNRVLRLSALNCG